MMKSTVSNSVVQIGIVFRDARTYNLMYKTWSGLQFSWGFFTSKGNIVLTLWPTDHNA